MMLMPPAPVEREDYDAIRRERDEYGLEIGRLDRRLLILAATIREVARQANPELRARLERACEEALEP